MRFSSYCAIIFAISTIVVTECNLIYDTVPISSSVIKLLNKEEGVPKAKLMGHLPIVSLKLPSFVKPNNIYPAALTFASPQLIDAPKIMPIPSATSGLIMEAPIIESILEPSEDHINYPHQPEPKLTDQEIEELKSARDIANRIGDCSTDSLNKCDIFKLAGGIVCSNTSAGVVCDNLDFTPCTDLINDACYDFTDTAGVFCSEGGCAQYK